MHGLMTPKEAIHLAQSSAVLGAVLRRLLTLGRTVDLLTVMATSATTQREREGADTQTDG
jgi:hypothetical protein